MTWTPTQLTHFECGGAWTYWQDDTHTGHATCDRCHHDQTPVTWPAISATMITDDRWTTLVHQWPQVADTQPEQAPHMTNPDNYPTDYTDDDNPTTHAIRAIQAEAVAKERTRITNALHALARPTKDAEPFSSSVYTEGWNDALERATLHAQGDRP